MSMKQVFTLAAGCLFLSGLGCLVVGDAQFSDDTLELGPVETWSRPQDFASPRFPPPSARTMVVRVRRPEGTPVRGASVSCSTTDALTDAMGWVECFEPTDPNDWPVQVTAAKDGQSGLTLARGDETEVDVVLLPPRTIRGRVEGPWPSRPVKLTFNSSTERFELPLLGPNFFLEDRSAVHGFLCLVGQDDHTDVLGCSRVDGDGEIVLPIGPPGRLELEVVNAWGLTVGEPIFYLDRVRTRPEALDDQLSFAVAPGSHTLVVNVQGSRERAEIPFSVVSREVTRLGAVQVR